MLDAEMIERIITETEKTLDDKYRECLKSEIEEIIDERKTYDEMSQWKVDQKDYLIHFYKKDKNYAESVVKALGKIGRRFNTQCHFCRGSWIGRG